MKRTNHKRAIAWSLMIMQMGLLCSCGNQASTPVVINTEPKQVVESNMTLPNTTNTIKLCSLPAMYKSSFDQEPVSCTPCVDDIPIASDFSNVINFEQFSGFTEGQLEMLYENGFVVIQPSKYPELKLHQVYEGAQYSNTPIFISTDAAFNLYHIFYDESLKALESSLLNDEIRNFSENMLEVSLAAYQAPQYKEIKEQLGQIVAYYGVANSLLGSEKTLPNELQSLVAEEVALINKAEQSIESPLLKKKMDYSQYIPRGHYAGTERLTTYFKVMMWYGQVGYVILDDHNQFSLENAQLSLLMSSLIFSSTEAVKSWDKVYTATSIYVGNADDLTLYEMQAVIDEVFGDEVDLLKIVDTSYESKIEKAMKALPEPKIQAKIVLDENTNAGKQFRVMGQRYTIDADVMQSLMQPMVRPVPSGLDVMAALGSERACELTEEYENPQAQWEEYEPILEKLRASIKVLSNSEWQTNLYSGWIWALQAATTSFENVEGMPGFMRNVAWTDKSIHTALGSYAELKHDTVLYAKQATAEMGGPVDNMPYLYVEPNIEVYARLLTLTNNTKEALASRGLLTDEAVEVLDCIRDDIEVLLSCSKKELTNESFTEEEYDELTCFGGMIDWVSVRLWEMNQEIDDSTAQSYTSALVSDVANMGSQCLELGSGIPYKIYVICPYKDKLFLAEGAVFSYYEFVSDTRLTDENWHQLLGIEKVKMDEGYEYIDVKAPAEKLNELRPKWVKSFVSMEPNQVSATGVKVVWDDAMLPNNPTPMPEYEDDYE